MPYLILGLILFALGKRVVDKKHATNRATGGKQETPDPGPNIGAALAASEPIRNVEIATALDRQENPKDQQGNSGQSDNKWMTRFTGLILLTTVVYAIVSFLQWRESIKTRELENRAYVGMKGGSLNSTYQSGQLPMVVNVQVQNIGKTPARNCTMFARIGFSDTDEPPPNMAYDGQPLVLDMLPGETYWSETVVNNILPEVKEGVERSGATLHVWGIITYDDVFGNRHKTTFCLQNKAADSVNFKGCSKGNTFE